jgi:nitrite reductase/ring-hydroxylating ferredoxin subunit
MLALELDRYLTPDGELILCGWHGAVFEPLTGLCVGGPCAGGRLTPWPVRVVGGIVRTA